MEEKPCRKGLKGERKAEPNPYHRRPAKNVVEKYNSQKILKEKVDEGAGDFGENGRGGEEENQAGK